MKSALTFFFLSIVLLNRAYCQITYYISPTGDNSNIGTIASPWKTIEKARDVIAARVDKPTQSFIVYLRGGNYPISTSITFNNTDGGTGNNTVTYKAYNNEKPVFTGGQNVTGWTTVANKPYWKASVSFDEFRQLYVNGTRCQRARTNHLITGTDWLPLQAKPTTATGYVVKSGEAQVYQNVQDVEIHQQIDWHDAYFPVTSMSETSGKVYITAPSMNSFFWTGLSPFYSFHIENALELLDQPGEWYCDKTTNILYYYPKNGEIMNTVEVTIPVTEKFIDVKGTLSNKVNNLFFEGITFEYAGWSAPNRRGWFGTQSTLLSQPSNAPGGQTLAHIYIEHAKNVMFKKCIFQHLGAVALDFRNGIYYGGVNESNFFDVGDAGVAVSSASHDALSGDEDSCNYVSIKNNTFSKQDRILTEQWLFKHIL